MITLGDLEFVESAYSGFAYPARRTQLTLLENEIGDTGNVVIQEGANPYREARLSAVLETRVDMLTLRGYEESGEALAMIDNDLDERSVLVFTATFTQRAASTWDVTMVLLELTPPADDS